MKPYILNAIVGVLKQGNVSRDNAGDGACLYRGPNGLKCVVGHLIDDAHYSDWMEGDGVCADGVLAAVRASYPDASPDTLHILQVKWHDDLPDSFCHPSVEAWRNYAIDDLPDFVDRNAVRKACAEQGVTL